MQELSQKLAMYKKTDSKEKLKEARNIIVKLNSQNLRWNISQLKSFLVQRQKELFF